MMSLLQGCGIFKKAQAWTEKKKKWIYMYLLTLYSN